MWEFVKSATNPTNWVEHQSSEICFIGRSNVGKSSLINALAQNKIARTSNTPGRTQLINFFIKDKVYLVDLPGYGYAKMSKKSKLIMVKMVKEYLVKRKQLVKVFVLIDAKVGFMENDLLLINFLKAHKRDFMIVLTKSDKANQSQLYHIQKEASKIDLNFIITSASTKKNIKKFDKIIMSILNGN